MFSCLLFSRRDPQPGTHLTGARRLLCSSDEPQKAKHRFEIEHLPRYMFLPETRQSSQFVRVGRCFKFPASKAMPFADVASSPRALGGGALYPSLNHNRRHFMTFLIQMSTGVHRHISSPKPALQNSPHSKPQKTLRAKRGAFSNPKLTGGHVVHRYRVLQRGLGCFCELVVQFLGVRVLVMRALLFVCLYGGP